MLLALSTYAVSGSPTTVDPTCDKSAVWTQDRRAPANPCHIDLSNGANFNASALATAIANLRGKELGCVYDLPPPPVGPDHRPRRGQRAWSPSRVTSTIPRRSTRPTRA